MQNKIFFDFDKTLINTNSFPRWIFFILAKSIASTHIRLSIRILSLLFRRKILKSITHEELKKEIISLPFSQEWDRDFFSHLMRLRRPVIWERLHSHLLAGEHILISSAAPERYLRLISEYFPLESLKNIKIVGARVEGGVLMDNYKLLKLSNLYSSGFIARDDKLYAMYTDSWDDASIAKISKSIFLVAPDDLCLQRYKSSDSLAKRVTIIN